MKYILVFVLAIFAVVSSKEFYSTENDDYDIEPILKNETQLKAFADCFTDNSECTELMSQFKKNLSEAVQQGCDKCTPAQKNHLKRFLEELKKKLPAEYQGFKDKFDPTGQYLAPLEVALAKP